MTAFLLILLAVITRILPHASWFNFTAVGGSLLYFGARRPLRESFLAVLPLLATDYYLTTYVYGYPFHATDYLVTWGWYVAAVVLGAILLKQRATAGRVVGASLLSSTSFFAVSNFAVWSTSALYAHTFAGLGACYAVALPFYRNDALSTLLVTGLAFGIPALLRRSAASHAPSDFNAAA